MSVSTEYLDHLSGLEYRNCWIRPSLNSPANTDSNLSPRSRDDAVARGLADHLRSAEDALRLELRGLAVLAALEARARVAGPEETRPVADLSFNDPTGRSSTDCGAADPAPWRS